MTHQADKPFDMACEAACRQKAHEHLYINWAAQKHPWFRKGLPESLDVDAYNSHFVELSKAPDIIESREAIKKVMQVRKQGG